MPRRQRFAVCVLFGLGFIVTIAGIARIWFVYDSLIRSYDQTWYAYPLWISAAVEIDLGVVSLTSFFAISTALTSPLDLCIRSCAPSSASQAAHRRFRDLFARDALHTVHGLSIDCSTSLTSRAKIRNAHRLDVRYPGRRIPIYHRQRAELRDETLGRGGAAHHGRQ